MRSPKTNQDRTQTHTVPTVPELVPEAPGMKNWGKDPESLHCIPEADITLYVNYPGIKNKKQKTKNWDREGREKSLEAGR